jgi:hypothetical protein
MHVNPRGVRTFTSRITSSGFIRSCTAWADRAHVLTHPPPAHFPALSPSCLHLCSLDASPEFARRGSTGATSATVDDLDDDAPQLRRTHSHSHHHGNGAGVLDVDEDDEVAVETMDVRSLCISLSPSTPLPSSLAVNPICGETLSVQTICIRTFASPPFCLHPQAQHSNTPTNLNAHIAVICVPPD